MNKKYKSLTISLITIFFLINFLLKSEILINTFFNTTKLWFYNLFPTIFVFFIITDILNNYNFPHYISSIFGKVFYKIFKIPQEASYIIFMSMTSGFPGNSKLIKEQLDKQTINSYDATKILTMTHFSNPLFIIYTVGINFFHDKKIGIIILLSHFITNFIVGFLFRNIYKSNYALKPLKKESPIPFMTLLKNSISNTFKTVIIVYGIVIFFSIINVTINEYLNLLPFTNMLFNGLLEITNGLNLLSTLSLPKIQASVIATFMISFGGFSIHMQVMSILNKYQINYYIYLIARIIHAALSSLIVFLLINH